MPTNPAEPATELRNPAPVAQSDRISSIDTLRGFALLGILLMNISGFALPAAVDTNPYAVGAGGNLNFAVWAIRYVLFDGRMRTIFSMLFGAGVVLLTSRLDARGEGKAADVFTRRNMWLVFFGLIHAYFIWDGDILYFYGITALLFLYPCRKLPARTLILAGASVFLAAMTYHTVKLEQHIQLAHRNAAATAAEKTGRPFTDQQKEDQKTWQDLESDSHPSKADLDKEIADYRGSYFTVLRRYAAFASTFESTTYYRFAFCDPLGMMLIGMGLMRMGFLNAQLSYKTYASITAAGYAIGLPLGILSIHELTKNAFSTLAIFNWEYLPYDWARLAIGIADAALVMIIVKVVALRWITKPLAAVGQTALSNYLGTSVICTLVFNGYGLGLFAKLQFYQLFFVVAGVWAVNMTLSTIWLKYYRFGPVEWLWRSLTYWKRQPMRRSHAPSAINIALADA